MQIRLVSVCLNFSLNISSTGKEPHAGIQRATLVSADDLQYTQNLHTWVVECVFQEKYNFPPKVITFHTSQSQIPKS